MRNERIRFAVVMVVAAGVLGETWSSPVFAGRRPRDFDRPAPVQVTSNDALKAAGQLGDVHKLLQTLPQICDGKQVDLTGIRLVANLGNATASQIDARLKAAEDQINKLLEEFEATPEGRQAIEDFLDADSPEEALEELDDTIEDLEKVIEGANDMGQSIEGVRASKELYEARDKLKELKKAVEDWLKWDAEQRKLREEQLRSSNTAVNCPDPNSVSKVEVLRGAVGTASLNWQLRDYSAGVESKNWNEIYVGDRYNFSNYVDFRYTYEIEELAPEPAVVPNPGLSNAWTGMAPINFPEVNLEWRPLSEYDPRIMAFPNHAYLPEEFNVKVGNSYVYNDDVDPFLKDDAGETMFYAKAKYSFGGISASLDYKFADEFHETLRGPQGTLFGRQSLDAVVMPFNQNFDPFLLNGIGKGSSMGIGPLDLILVKPLCYKTTGSLAGEVNWGAIPADSWAFSFPCSPDPAEQQTAVDEAIKRIESDGFGSYAGKDGYEMFAIGVDANFMCGGRYRIPKAVGNPCDMPKVDFVEWAFARGLFVESRPGRKRPKLPAKRKGDGPNDLYLHTQGTWGQKGPDLWALKRIGLPLPPVEGPFYRRREGKPVIVAVVDTGVDFGHPELFRRFWYNQGEVANNGIDDDKNGFVDDTFGWNFAYNSNDVRDDNGHGTFVSGIIAAQSNNGIGIAGINPWARLMSLKVAEFNGHTDSVFVARAIAYAAENGARVINVSIGGRSVSAIEKNAIALAAHHGALVVVAAGNSAVNTSDISPAGIPGAITVTATGPDDYRAPFSNFGDSVDLAAPGVDILSLRGLQTDIHLTQIEGYKPGDAIVGTDKQFYLSSGTSFSAPFVTGVASLLFALRPELTAEQVRRMILNSARDIEGPGVDHFTGYGLIDARAALAADPEFFVSPFIRSVSLAEEGGKTLIRVSGDADADRFAKAWLESGEGKAPKKWRAVGTPMDTPVRDGTLALVDPGQLGSGGKYMLRLVVEHKSGFQREHRYKLDLQ